MIGLMKALGAGGSSYVFVGVVLIAAAGWTASGVQSLRLADANRTVVRSRAELGASRQNLGRCEASAATIGLQLEAQNKAVGRLSAEGARRVASAARAVRDAERARASVEARAARLLATPLAASDACARAEAARVAVIGALK